MCTISKGSHTTMLVSHMSTKATKNNAVRMWREEEKLVIKQKSSGLSCWTIIHSTGIKDSHPAILLRWLTDVETRKVPTAISQIKADDKSLSDVPNETPELQQRDAPNQKANDRTERL